MMNYNWPDDEL